MAFEKVDEMTVKREITVTQTLTLDQMNQGKDNAQKALDALKKQIVDLTASLKKANDQLPIAQARLDSINKDIAEAVELGLKTQAQIDSLKSVSE